MPFCYDRKKCTIASGELNEEVVVVKIAIPTSHGVITDKATEFFSVVQNESDKNYANLFSKKV